MLSSMEGSDRVGQTLLRKYRLERLLGRGGMGIVYAATNLATGREVAIKVLGPGAMDASVSRFLDEARAATAVRHPNVVDVLDLDTAEDGTPFIVMELLRGETLRELLDRRKRLGLAEAWTVLRPAMRAIGHAHARGIVHRDIKPENLFLADDGHGGRTTKVLDFGIARVGASQRTAVGTQLGTPFYMSPEQARGVGVGATTDVWAMGIVWFELLTGKLPFELPRDATAASVLAIILTARPSSLLYQEVVPAVVAAVIDRALSSSPADRPSDMAAFEAALEAALTRGPGRACAAIGEEPTIAVQPEPAAAHGRNLRGRGDRRSRPVRHVGSRADGGRRLSAVRVRNG
jgi:serine/threonine protein kinase